MYGHDVGFDKAINIARENAEKLLSNASDFMLEEALLSQNNKNYEITFSYTIKGAGHPGTFKGEHNHGMQVLTSYLRDRKSMRTFIVERETGIFKGFRMLNG